MGGHMAWEGQMEVKEDLVVVVKHQGNLNQLVAELPVTQKSQAK